MMAAIALAQRNTSRAAAHTAISWETATASSKMDYPYNILISSLHGLQARPVSQQIWYRCQLLLGSTRQVSALQSSLPVAAPKDLKGSPNIIQLGNRFASAWEKQLFVKSLLSTFCAVAFYATSVGYTGGGCLSGVHKTKCRASDTVTVRPSTEAITWSKAITHLKMWVTHEPSLPAIPNRGVYLLVKHICILLINFFKPSNTSAFQTPEHSAKAKPRVFGSEATISYCI